MASLITPILPQPPKAQLPYVFNWAKWLESGETIVSAVWTVDAALTIETSFHDDTTATVYLKTPDVPANTKLKVSCTVTSSASQTKKDTRVFYIRCEDL